MLGLCWKGSNKEFHVSAAPDKCQSLLAVSRQCAVQFIFISWWDNINYAVKNDAGSDNDCSDRIMTTPILTIITCSSSSMMSV